MRLEKDFETQFKHERLRRLRAETDEDLDSKNTFLESVNSKMDPIGVSRVYEALRFAQSVNYQHVGLTSRAYFNHPIRVAQYVLEESTDLDVDTIVIALVHNILEVSNVTQEILQSQLGETVAVSVANLTVDRKQTSQQYKCEYYNRLHNGFKGAMLVKALDKLDNVFMICFNPDAQIRLTYLDEVEAQIQPIVDEYIPSLSDYFRQLNRSMRNIGYLNKQLYLNSMDGCR